MASLARTKLKYECWLWPDKIIRKRESRRLRQEHNQVVNSCDKLVEACWEILARLDTQVGTPADPRNPMTDPVYAGLRNALALATVGPEGGAL